MDKGDIGRQVWGDQWEVGDSESKLSTRITDLNNRLLEQQIPLRARTRGDHVILEKCP
jgi:hypothetical protein